MSRPKHHILYTRNIWRSQENTKQLRSNQWLQVPIEHDNHAALHRELATVPISDHFMTDRVIRDFEPVPFDYGATIDSLMFAFEAASRHHKAGRIEKEVGGLIVASIDLQRQYLDL